MQHTDRAVADLIDALRNISPALYEHAIRYTLASGLMCVIIAFLMFGAYLFMYFKIKSMKDDDPLSYEDKKSLTFMAYWFAAIIGAITVTVLLYNGFTSLLAPEGATICRLIGRC